MSKRGDDTIHPRMSQSYPARDGDYTQHETIGGMTLREHYAGLMMAAGLSTLTDESDPVTPAEAARCAVANADALIRELSKAQP